MATFIHIAPESSLPGIRRNGISASRFSAEANPSKGVFCFPVQSDFFITHQWLRELRRFSREVHCGVYFRIPDSQTVYIGRFNKPPLEMRASEAIAMMQVQDGLGVQVIIPHSISRREILRIKRLPQVVGWRVYPEAKGNQPMWPLRGGFSAQKMRKGIKDKEQRDKARYFSRFSSDWYSDE